MLQRGDRQFASSARELNRRRWLQACGAGGVGLNLLSLMAARGAAKEAGGAASTSAIRSCICVFLYGGPSHLDTFDMKPDAPAEVRGEFKPVATSVPGLQICEHLPHLARMMHKVALVRTMHHTNRLHDSASIETFTGRQGPDGDREEFAPIPQFFPCHGAVIHFLQQHLHRDVYHAVLPWLFHNVVDVPCQGGGFLGSKFDPFLIAGDPKSVTYNAEMLARPQDLSLQRISRRRELLGSLDAPTLAVRKPARELTDLYDQAYNLLDSQQLKIALEIEREDDAVRRRYGMVGEVAQGGGNGAEKAFGRNLRGQNLLMARRLVEAGVPFVRVNDFRQQGQNWDAHADNFRQHREHLLPPVDQALAALIDDLDERGLLDSTLVIALGEFGRTPQINQQAGRDHWPDCYTVLLAGGGIQGGSVYGTSDKQGAYPEIDPVTPADLAATIYHRFGIPPTTEIVDVTGRPWRLSDGQVLTSLFA